MAQSTGHASKAATAVARTTNGNRTLFLLLALVVALGMLASARHMATFSISSALPVGLHHHARAGGEDAQGDDNGNIADPPAKRVCSASKELGDMTDDDDYEVGAGAGSTWGVRGMREHTNVCAVQESERSKHVTFYPESHKVVKALRSDRSVQHSRVEHPVFSIRRRCDSLRAGREVAAYFSLSKAKHERSTDGHPLKALQLMLGHACWADALSNTQEGDGGTGKGPAHLPTESLWTLWLDAAFTFFGSSIAAVSKHAAGELPIEESPLLLFGRDVGVKKVVCFKQVFEWHNHWMWFPTLHSAHDLRVALRKLVEPTGGDSGKGANAAKSFSQQRKLRAVIVDSGDLAANKMVSFLQQKFGAVVDVSSFDYREPSLARSWKLLAAASNADVLVGAHHHSLAAVLAMPAGAVVVEFSAFGAREFQYEELSRELMVHHLAVESEPSPDRSCCEAQLSKGKGMLSLELAGHRATNSTFGASCKPCGVAIPDWELYYTFKNAIATVWLKNSRMSQVHDFDVRK